MKDYQQFKTYIQSIVNEIVLENGREIKAKQWRKVSPYQKRRYKSEYWYPEVWLYNGYSRQGAVITGEDIQEFKEREKVKEYIINCLF